MLSPTNPTFDDAQLQLLQPALDRAEELVGDRFAVGSFDRSPHAYDVRTLAQLDPSEVPTEPAMAQLIRYGRGGARRAISRFHRICLHDSRILACSRREQLDLDALLLVVLTHELIHLVRFTGAHSAYHVPADQRAAEEDEVDRLTRELLARYPDHAVRDAVAVVAVER